MRRLVFAISGDYAQLTGGYAYDRRIIGELRKLGWQADWLDVGDGFPRPSAEVRAGARRLLASVPPGTPIMIDGLVYGVMPDTMTGLCATHPLIALVHHPLALESGWSEEQARALWRSEHDALVSARHVVVTSETTARILAQDYHVPRERLTVAVPGTDRVAPARGGDGRTVSLLAVGAVVPRKGYDVLLAALALLRHLPWRLTIAGDLGRNVAAVAHLRADIARRGLGDRVSILGGVRHERLAELYAEADVFVLASRYEGYGMVYAEAIAHGVPVIGTTGGAIPEAVPPEAGILVPPEDADALADALGRLIGRQDERARYAAGARRAAESQPRWDASAALIARAIEAVR